MQIISGAGHHVYADKPKEFNEYVQYLLETFENNNNNNYDDDNNNYENVI